MAAEHFFNRWARPKPPLPDGADLNAASRRAPSPAPNPAGAIDKPPATGARPLPTLADVAGLNRDSDYSPFLAQGVDETVKRSALKKLFADPHFNVMDGLDTYIDDYGKPDPMPPGMLAMLNHARDLLDPLAQLTAPACVPADVALAPDDSATVAAVATDASPPVPAEADASSISVPDAGPASPCFATSDHAAITPKGAA